MHEESKPLGGALLARASSPPTLGGVQASQEQHLVALRRLAKNSRTIADHLLGGEPEQTEGGFPPTAPGTIHSMHDNMMQAAALGETINYNLGRIERALGIPPLDEALASAPEVDYRAQSMPLTTGRRYGR